MSTYNGDPRPQKNEGAGGYMNFDYGLLDKKTNMWFHANHSEPGMRVHQSTLNHYSKPKKSFNRQVFSIGITTVPIK